MYSASALATSLAEDAIHTGRWLEQAKSGDYRARDIGTSHPQRWAIEGLLPSTGAAMVFGAGGVGKTQLLTWLAAHLAATGDGASEYWLGAPIRRRGQIMLLSAEDLREQLLGRLASILRAIAREGAAVDAATLGERIHLLPSDTLRGVEEFSAAWNDEHDEADHIIGMILDSAVSMVGFTSTTLKPPPTSCSTKIRYR